MKQAMYQGSGENVDPIFCSRSVVNYGLQRQP